MSTQIDLGPVLSVPKGDWNANTTYERLNLVRHNSASWICNVATSKGVEPTEDSTDWYLQVKDTSSVTSVNGMKGDVVIKLTETETPPANDDSNRIATTEWVVDKLGDVDLSGIKDDTVLAAQLASNLEVSKDTLSYAELIDYIAKVERNVGLPMGIPIPYTGKDVPAGFLRADGVTYTNMNVSFPDFYNWVVISGLTVPLANYALVEGNCGYYGLDEATGTVRMPTITNGFVGAAVASQYGQAVEAGLPNITGALTHGGINSGYEGAFKNERSFSGVGRDAQPNYVARFDASLSNPIYGKSNTVTPSHVKYPWIISIYNTAVAPSVAQAGEFVELLDGKADKSSVESIKAYITETWSSGTSWYRKWSDGWIEQGGRIIGTNTSGHQTLHTAFSSDVYTLVGSGWCGDTSYTPHFTFAGRTSTSFSWGSSQYSSGISWYACGY